MRSSVLLAFGLAMIVIGHEASAGCLHIRGLHECPDPVPERPTTYRDNSDNEMLQRQAQKEKMLEQERKLIRHAIASDYRLIDRNLIGLNPYLPENKDLKWEKVDLEKYTAQAEQLIRDSKPNRIYATAILQGLLQAPYDLEILNDPKKLDEFYKEAQARVDVDRVIQFTNAGRTEKDKYPLACNISRLCEYKLDVPVLAKSFRKIFAESKTNGELDPKKLYETFRNGPNLADTDGLFKGEGLKPHLKQPQHVLYVEALLSRNRNYVEWSDPLIPTGIGNLTPEGTKPAELSPKAQRRYVPDPPKPGRPDSDGDGAGMRL